MTKLPLMIPNPSYQTMKAIHTYHSCKEKFSAFLHCTKNLFLRKLLYLRQHGRCIKCGKLMTTYKENTCIHHNSYNNYCQFPDPEISIYCPRKNGKYSAKVPNCELCYYKYPDFAESCLNNLCLLHTSCHNDLHKDN